VFRIQSAITPISSGMCIIQATKIISTR